MDDITECGGPPQHEEEYVATTAGSNGTDAISESGMHLCAEGSYHIPTYYW